MFPEEIDETPKTANKLDVYLEHLNPMIRRKLTPKQAEKMEKYSKIFAWRCKLFSPEQTRKLIMQEYNLSYSWAAELYTDMEYVFGNDKEVNKNVEKRVLLEYYHQALSLAVKGKDTDPLKAAMVVASITEKIGKMLGVNAETEIIPAKYTLELTQVNFYEGKVKSSKGLEVPFSESEVVE